MKVRIRKRVLEALRADYPGRRLWVAYEALSRQEINDLRRDGYSFAVEIDGIYYYGK